MGINARHASTSTVAALVGLVLAVRGAARLVELLARATGRVRGGPALVAVSVTVAPVSNVTTNALPACTASPSVALSAICAPAL